MGRNRSRDSQFERGKCLMGLCTSKDNVNVDGLAHMETDGLPDPLTDPSAEKTKEFIRQISETEQGQRKEKVNVQITFIERLKRISTSHQGQLKKHLNDELKLKAAQAAVKKVFDDLMSTIEGERKAAVNAEIRTKAGAQRDIETVLKLKQTLQGQYKQAVMDELMSEETSEKLQRQVSRDARNLIEQITQAYGCAIFLKESQNLATAAVNAVTQKLAEAVVVNINYNRTH